MKEERSIKKNFLYRLVYEILIIVAPLITTPYISRVLQAKGIGKYSYSFSIVTYFTIFAALGTAFYGEREISMCRDDKVLSTTKFWEIEILTIFTAAISFVLWLIICYIYTDYRFYFLALSPFILAVAADISWFYTAQESVKYSVVLNAISKIIAIVLLFTLVRNEDDIYKYFWINSGVQLLGNLSMWIFLPFFLENKLAHPLHPFAHIKKSFVYFVPTVAISIYTVLDKTLIGAITGSDIQNGYYEQATKIITIAKTISFSALNGIMGARISYLFSKNRTDELVNRLKTSIQFILIMGCGSMFGIIGISKYMVPVFFGQGYDPVVFYLLLMSPLVIIIGISGCLGSQYLSPCGKIKISSKFVIIGAIINLVINIILIPYLYSVGAIIATLVAESVVTLLFMRECKSIYTWGDLIRDLRDGLIAGILMMGFVYYSSGFISRSFIGLIGLIVFGCGIYVAILLIIRNPIILKIKDQCIEYVRRKVT